MDELHRESSHVDRGQSPVRFATRVDERVGRHEEIRRDVKLEDLEECLLGSEWKNKWLGVEPMHSKSSSAS